MNQAGISDHFRLKIIPLFLFFPLRERSIITRGGLHALLLLIFLLSGCISPPVRKEIRPSQDKLFHFCASGLVAGTVTEMARLEDRNQDERFLMAMGVTLTLGLVKETLDHSFWDQAWSWGDLMYSLLGGLTGTLIVSGFN